ncbi:hypothetical protein Vafri_1289 [Volvox africanus]|nr:hypothetical protein Vafri_1289 [Volvox africanus]
MGLLAGLWIGALVFTSVGSLAAAPPASVIAVANRDAEGAVVKDADETHNYQPSGAACREDCLNTTGCNIWIWCGAVSGCSSGGSSTRNPNRFQQCWLKSDVPPRSRTSSKFPRAKNMPDQATGWMSGTTIANFTDVASFPEKGYSCGCLSDYGYGGYTFKGVCAAIENYGASCMVGSGCRDAPSNGLQGCPSYQPCTILLDTDLNETQILTSGESNSADSAEDCCFQCAQTKGCNTWTWCADATGCNGQRYRFRQCWLKQADPNNPQPKKSYGGSPGWISGVRQAWLPAK